MATRNGAGKVVKVVTARRELVQTICGSVHYRRKRYGALALYTAVQKLNRSNDEGLEALPDDDPKLVSARALQRQYECSSERFIPVCGGGCGEPPTNAGNVAGPVTWVEQPVGLCWNCTDQIAAAADVHEALSDMPMLEKNPLVAVEGLASMAATFAPLVGEGCPPVADTLEDAHAVAKGLRRRRMVPAAKPSATK